MYRSILLASVAFLAQAQMMNAQQEPAVNGQDVPKKQEVQAAPNAEQFAREASQSNLFDIEAARLATVRAKDSDTSTFAQQVLNDQLKAQADLKVAAQEEGVNVATALDGDHQRKLEALENLQGERFDTAFYSVQMDAHRSALKLLADYGARGERESLRAYAQSYYSTIKINFARAQTDAAP